MDKRIEIGRDKYNLAHKEFILICTELLKDKSFSNVNFNLITKESTYSKTTLYNHFDSDINLLFKECLIYFRDELISKFILTDDSSNNIKNIYRTYFQEAFENPLYFKNMHMISIHLNTLNDKKYKYKSKIFELIKSNFENLDSNLDFISNWSYATILCLQIGNLDFDFESQKKQFFKNLEKNL